MKLAGHVEDRLAERSKLHPDVLAEARSRLKKLPQGSENTYHWTLRNEDDQVQGHLAVRRVGKARAPILTTFLSPHMTPSGPELSSTLGRLSPAPQEKSASGGEKVVFAGLRVRIDRPKGFVQEGRDAAGKPWKRVYKVDYGFLPKTEGGDGEDLDVFLGPNEQSKTAYLIHQKKGDGTFDEFKLMLGFNDAASAKSCYLDHVPEKFFSKMEEVSLHLVKALLGYPLDTMKIAMEAFGEKLAAPEHKKRPVPSISDAVAEQEKALGRPLSTSEWDALADKVEADYNAGVKADLDKYRADLQEHAGRPRKLEYAGSSFATDPVPRPKDLDASQLRREVQKEELQKLYDHAKAQGVKVKNLSDDQIADYRKMIQLSEIRQQLPPQVIRGLGDAAEHMQPGQELARFGLASNPNQTREQQLHHGTRLKELVKELETSNPEDGANRTRILQEIMREDADVLKARGNNALRGFGKATLPALKDLARQQPGQLAKYVGGAAGLAALQFGARPLQRAGFRHHFLSKEERQLPEEEQSKLLLERSPAYKRLFAKSEETSDFTAQDVLNPAIDVPAMGFLGSELRVLDELSGGHARRALGPHETLARLTGAQQFWHGTDPSSGEKILGTKTAPGTGIDPGHGGRVGGFTWKSTNQDALAHHLRRATELRALSDDDLRKVEEHAIAVGAPVKGGDLLSELQPKQFLPGLASTGAPGHLDLDTSHFLPNAKGNYFVATDRDAAAGYARAMSPEVYMKPLEQVRASGGRIEELLKEHIDNQVKGLPSKLNIKDLAQPAKDLAVGGLQMSGVLDPAPDKKYLIGGVMPIEKFHRLHEVDSDDVKQRGYAYRLKPENRVTPYAPGEAPDPSAHGRAIGVEHLNQNQATLKQIWQNRSESPLDYIRGVGLPDDQRALGLNKRFLSGVGRAGGLAGTAGMLYAGSGLHPLVKKLYRKARGDSAPTSPEAFGEKLGAARWVKKLREGGDLAEEIAQRMGVSPGNRQILEETGGVLTPHGLPRPGLGQKGVNVEEALPALRDPTTSPHLILDLEDPRGQLPPRRKPKTIGEQLAKASPDDFRSYEDQPGLTAADALAINTNPALLNLKNYTGISESGRPRASTTDLLQLGSNPGLEVEALMDPPAAEGVRNALLHRTHQERAFSRSEEAPSRLRRLIERRKGRLQESAPRSPPVPLSEELGAIDVGAVDRYSIDKNQEAIDAQLRRNFHKSPWYDSQGENPAQLGLPGVTPRAEDVGREGKHLRFEKEMDQLRAEGGRPPALNSNRSLFWEDADGYNYTPSQVLFPRPPAPTLLDAKGNPHALAHQVPPPKPAAPAKAPEETPTLAEVSGSGPSLASEAPNPVPARGGPTLRQLAGAGGGLLGLAALGRHFHKKRKAAKAQEEASES